MTEAEQGTGLAFDLRGSVTVVTGGSKGIGAAIASAFARAGSDLVLVARSENRLRQQADALRSDTGCQVEPVVADISDAQGTDTVLRRVTDKFGRVDVLVNNAHSTGDHRGRSLFEIDDDVWKDVLATNLLGPARLARLLGKMMLGGNGGSIINIVSGSGFLPSASGLGPYGASKAALWLLTRYLAVEGAPKVRVNAICPGVVSEDGQPRNDAQAAILPAVPLGRLGLPHEVAGAALYLASPMASYTTGAVITVNGGRSW